MSSMKLHAFTIHNRVQSNFDQRGMLWWHALVARSSALASMLIIFPHNKGDCIPVLCCLVLLLMADGLLSQCCGPVNYLSWWHIRYLQLGIIGYIGRVNVMIRVQACLDCLLTDYDYSIRCVISHGH